jgi:hypothetical protein
MLQNAGSKALDFLQDPDVQKGAMNAFRSNDARRSKTYMPSSVRGAGSIGQAPGAVGGLGDIVGRRNGGGGGYDF